MTEAEQQPTTTRPVPSPPKHPLTQPIPIPANGKKVARRRRRRRGRLPDIATVFVGPMAAGKTSLGRKVAKDLSIPFVDTDAVFVRSHGTITDFFEVHGEAEFRRIEAEIIEAELSREGPRIVALGGGAVLSEETRETLSKHPVVLLMTTQAAVMRTANIARRPLLRDDPDAWNRILAERKHLYFEVSNVTFRTDRASKEQLARKVISWMRSQGKKYRRPGSAEARPDSAEARPDSGNARSDSDN